MKVAILAKGETLANFKRNHDEVWGLNQLALTHSLDRLFVMDDLVYRMPHYDGPEFPDWLKTYPGRIITSKAYPAWPTAEEFPLQAVARYFGLPLGIAMYGTVDYMIALAIYEGADHIDMFGVDCLPQKMELVRTSIAVWIGAAMSRGIRVTSQDKSFSRYWTYAGRCLEQGLYGYIDRPRIETLTESKED